MRGLGGWLVLLAYMQTSCRGESIERMGLLRLFNVRCDNALRGDSDQLMAYGNIVFFDTMSFFRNTVSCDVDITQLIRARS